jgi:hypothetical protein
LTHRNDNNINKVPSAKVHADVLQGFQPPFTTPTQVQQRPPSASVYAPTPQCDDIAVRPLSQPQQPPQQQQQQTASTPAKVNIPTPVTPARSTPKVGGKWTHPALQSIEQESRKFIFGEQQLKTLLANFALLYVLYSAKNRILDRFVSPPLEI